ncbi:MAG: GTP diphosphokinase [Gammaproteobacteria bacterium]|nr:GTP diphosphokinase [Gammaproteobacteria bacterium]
MDIAGDQAGSGKQCIDASAQQRVGALLARQSPEHGATLTRAIEAACLAHHDQLRKSGEPYYLHALAVAEILDELKLDYETLVAAVLHDVVEDTSTTIDDLGNDFGPTIARMVDGVTKMERIGEFHQLESADSKQSDQAESLRKLLLAMAEDVRVVLIKLADRLHNMRTLHHLDADRQIRIARETLDIYAPLANRLGIWQIKWELEDLSLRYLEPEAYQSIARQLAGTRTEREAYIARVIAMLDRELAAAGIKATVTGRSKHIYSIWRKMQRKRLSFEQIFDMHAIRILVDEEKDCYAALGLVHGLWRHIPKEFDDYIANPKENLYRSLHTAVVGPDGLNLEVQIRTHEMHRHAELGVAAHWRYKEGGGSDAGYEEKIAWLRQLLEWREEEHSADDFVDRFKSEAFQDRVYVLTPQGRIIDLPQGATPLDFAYAVHTEVGHRCRGAKVNGRIVTLTYPLQNGEQVEILTTRQSRPSRDWLNSHLGYLHTSRARARVRAWFKRQDHELNLSAGRTILDRELNRVGISDIPVEKIAERFRGRQVEEFLVALGSGEITTGQLAHSLGELAPHEDALKPKPPRTKRRKQSSSDGGFDIQGVGNLMTTTARCCRPVPNDPIIGYITRGRGVTIHRQDCGNVLRLQDEDRDRLIEVDWGEPGDAGYQVDILVEAYDRAGLLRDITSLLANEKINLTGANTQTDASDGIARMNLTLEISDISQLSRVLTRIGQLQNVIAARRKS